MIEKLKKIIDEKDETIHEIEKTMRDRESTWKWELDDQREWTHHLLAQRADANELHNQEATWALKESYQK